MEYIVLPELTEEKKGLLKKIKNHLEQNLIGYINVPTGWGKTFLSKHLILEYLNAGKKVLFVASKNKQLLRQTFFKDEDKEIALFPESICLTSDFPISRWKEDKIMAHIRDNDVNLIFASLQTLLSKKKVNLSNILTSFFDLVIVDEIHNFIKNQGNEYLNKIIENNANCHIFGMTATPFQGVIDNLKYVKEITANMKELFHKTVSECIIDNQLSPLNYYIVRNPVNIDLIFDFGERLEGLYSKDLTLDWNHLEEIVERTKLAKKVYDDKIDPNTKTLIFCSPIKNITQNVKGDKKKVTSFHAKLCAAIFNDEIKKKYDPEISLSNLKENGEFKDTVYLSSDLKSSEVEDLILAFKTLNKPPHVLCTVGMLVEGFNFPLLQNLILLRPTLSMRLFSQELGRVLRKHESKEAGNVFEVVDNVDLDTLYEKFGESLLSSTRMKRILMLNPEHRIENLLLQGKNDIQAFDKHLIEVREDRYRPIGVENIGLTKYDDKLTEVIKKFPPIDFRVKILAKLFEKVQLIKKGTFQKEKLILMNIASKIKLLSVDNVKEATELLASIESAKDATHDDMDLTQKVFDDKKEMLDDLGGFIKLKILTELENVPKLSNDTLKECAKLLGFKSVRLRMDDLKEKCILEGKGVTLKTFMEQKLPISMGVLTGELENKLKRKIKKGLISKNNAIFHKTPAKSDVLWAETYYHDEYDYLRQQYEDYYKKDEIELKL